MVRASFVKYWLADFTINWLELALDMNLETFEAEWRTWLREQVSITG
jgi:hypothetical protein